MCGFSSFLFYHFFSLWDMQLVNQVQNKEPLPMNNIKVAFCLCRPLILSAC